MEEQNRLISELLDRIEAVEAQQEEYVPLPGAVRKRDTVLGEEN